VLTDTDPDSVVICKSPGGFSEFNNAERQGTFHFSPTHLSESDLEEDRRMGRRWTERDICELRDLAQRYSAPRIAEMTNRTAGGVAFKAYQLKLSLRSSHYDDESDTDAQPESAGVDWTAADNIRTWTR
jgi:hypothetical protein